MTPKETADHVFARHPKVDEVHVTSDGQAFTSKDAADAHATRVKDRKIITFARGEEDAAAFAKAETTPPEQDPEKVGSTTAAVGTQPTDPAATNDDATFDDTSAEKILDGNISEVTERLEKVELVEAIDHLTTVETAGQNRKGVHEALAARKTAITQD